MILKYSEKQLFADDKKRVIISTDIFPVKLNVNSIRNYRLDKSTVNLKPKQT